MHSTLSLRCVLYAMCVCVCGAVVLSTTATTSFQHKHHSHNSLNSLALYRVRMNNFGKIQLIKYNSTRKAITTELLKLSTVSLHYARALARVCLCMLPYHLLIQPKSCVIFNVDVCLFDHTQTHSRCLTEFPPVLFFLSTAPIACRQQQNLITSFAPAQCQRRQDCIHTQKREKKKNM